MKEGKMITGRIEESRRAKYEGRRDEGMKESGEEGEKGWKKNKWTEVGRKERDGG